MKKRNVKKFVIKLNETEWSNNASAKLVNSNKEELSMPIRLVASSNLSLFVSIKSCNYVCQLFFPIKVWKMQAKTIESQEDWSRHMSTLSWLICKLAISSVETKVRSFGLFNSFIGSKKSKTISKHPISIIMMPTIVHEMWINYIEHLQRFHKLNK